MSTHPHSNNNSIKESTPPKTRTRRKKKTLPLPAPHVNGKLPITVTTTREVLIDAVGQMAASNGYAFAAHGDSDACVHEAEAFDLVPLTSERSGDLHGSWFWAVSLEDALVIVGHLDRDTPELPDEESDPVALGA